MRTRFARNSETETCKDATKILERVKRPLSSPKIQRTGVSEEGETKITNNQPQRSRDDSGKRRKADREEYRTKRARSGTARGGVLKASSMDMKARRQSGGDLKQFAGEKREKFVNQKR